MANSILKRKAKKLKRKRKNLGKFWLVSIAMYCTNGKVEGF